MNPFRSVYFLLLLAGPGHLSAQEIKFIDLASLSQRTNLRNPPALPADCKEGNCLGGGSGGGSVVDGAPDRRDPHALGISDLQPSDESVAFNYFSLALTVRGEAEPQGPPVSSIGFVELFGAPDHPESMMVLQPGEWIRVRANVKLLTWPSTPVSARFQGDFQLRRNTFHPHAGGQFVEAKNLYPNTTPTPFVAVRLLPHDGSDPPKQ
jgi:hypothetical protein